jgi:hypothetical protein
MVTVNPRWDKEAPNDVLNYNGTMPCIMEQVPVQVNLGAPIAYLRETW